MSRDALIADHLKLVYLMVGDFLRANPQFRNLRDDLNSMAGIKLIETVDRFDTHNAHFRNYLRISIRNGCWDVVRTENVIQRPRVHNAKRKPFFEEDRRPPSDDEEVGIPIDEHEDVEAPPEYLYDLEFHEFSSDELMGLICRDETDKWVWTFGLAQKSVPVIARELGLTRAEVKDRGLYLLRKFRDNF
jgi:RNA polymerase sigma factor (sigma-70 family)